MREAITHLTGHIRVKPPSLISWPGVPHPRLAYSSPQVLSGVSWDTRCPATLTPPDDT
jgi:hypothetical protein